MGTSLRRTPALLAVVRCIRAAGLPVWGLKVVKESGYPSGTVYPLLERLESAGMLESRWEDGNQRSGPRRRLYSLTPEGRKWVLETVAVSGKQQPRSTRAREALA